MTTVHIIMQSGNAKTGPIPVTISSKDTCPASCSLKGNGCYAEAGPLNIHWEAVSAGKRGTDWLTFCDTIRRLPKRQVWRHNQAGDLPGTADVLDVGMVGCLARANRGRLGFTFTHYPMSIPWNQVVVRHANQEGFAVNISAESLEEADHMLSLGVAPVATLLPSDAGKVTITPQGNRVVTCPATYRDDLSCAKCGNGTPLCARIDRDYIIGFPAHGVSVKKANRVFMLKSVPFNA